MPSLRLLVLLVAALAMLAPTAIAAAAQGELEAAALQLSPDATLASAGLDIASNGAHAPAIDLAATSAQIQRFGTTSARLDPGVAPSSTNLNQIDERASHASATITVLAGPGDQVFAIRTLGPATASIGSAHVRGIGGALLADAQIAGASGSTDPTQAPRCDLSTCLDVFGVYGITGSATATVSGEMTLLLYGPTLRVVADGQTTEYTSGVQHVQGTGPATQTEDAWVMVRAQSVTGTIGGEGLGLFAPAPTFSASGITFENAKGALRVGTQDHRASGDDVTTQGAIILTPAAVAPAADHGLQGEPVYAQSIKTRVSGDVQSIDLQGSIAFLDTPAKKAGAAAVLLAIAGGAAYAWQHLTFGLAAMYTRLNKPDILENDVRNHIYDIIRSNPGISAREVHRRSNQSWGTVVYHLRQLERHHLVVSRALGRTRNYYENHGKYKGMEAQLACLQSDRARILARAIVANPGITQEALAVVSQFPQPTTSYYVRKLKQAGLVEEQRDGRYVKYVPHADLPRYIQLSESSVQTGGSAGAGVQA